MKSMPNKNHYPEKLPKGRVVMFAHSELLGDPRAYRSAEALSSNGYRVSVVCLSSKQGPDHHDGIRIYRIKLIKYGEYIGKLIRSPKRHRHGARSARNQKQIVELANADQNSSNTQQRYDSKESNQSRWLRDMRTAIGTIRVSLALFLRAFKLKADVYHSNDLDTLPAGFLLSRIHSAELVYDAHELYPDQYGGFSSSLKRFLSLLEGTLIKRASRVITVNDSISRILQQRYGIERPVVVMNCPFYIDVVPLANQERETVRIIYHGGYEEERGLEELTLSAKYIDNGVLFFRGYGILEAKLRRTVLEEGLSGKVVFLGPFEMKDAAKSAVGFDIGVVISKSFPLNRKYYLPNKLFEYLMAGLAVAASDLPELRTVVLGKKVGSLFDTNDPKDIARAINELISDRRTLVEMKNNSLKCAREVYNWGNESVKLLRVYDDILLRGES